MKTVKFVFFFLVVLGTGLAMEKAGGGDTPPTFTVEIKDAPTSPGKIPVEAGHLFEAVGARLGDGKPLTPEQYTLSWSATAGTFRADYPGVYLAPEEPGRVTVTGRARLASSAEEAVARVTFDVVPSRFLGSASLAQRPFPHIARMRVAPKMYAQNFSPEDEMRRCLEYLRKYSVLTVDGNQLKYLSVLRNIDAAEHTDRVCLRFTQSGGGVSSNSFRLGLDAPNGKPYEKQPWPGFWLYRPGAKLKQEVTANRDDLVLHFETDIRHRFRFAPNVSPQGAAVGDYVVFFDEDRPPTVATMELAEVDSSVAIGGGDGKTLTLKSRGEVKLKGRKVLLDKDASDKISPHHFRVSTHRAFTTRVRPLDGRILLRETVDRTTLAIIPATTVLRNGERATFLVRARDVASALISVPACWTLSDSRAGTLLGATQFVDRVDYTAGPHLGTFQLTAKFRGTLVSAVLTIRDALPSEARIRNPAAGDYYSYQEVGTFRYDTTMKKSLREKIAMDEDEVLKEVHKAKDALGARFGFNISRLVDYFISRQKKHKRKCKYVLPPKNKAFIM